MTKRFLIFGYFFFIPAFSVAGKFELGLTLDTVYNANGGIETGSETLGNVDATYSHTYTSTGGELFLYALGNDGGDPSTRIGDAQVSSNIETNNTVKLYEAWYRHPLTEKLSITIGLHDYNSSFYVTEHSGLFINSSFGIGAETAQVSPSIFSTTAFGVVASIESDNHYGLFALYDGLPGDPDNDKGTHIAHDSGDGVFAAFEWGVVDGENASKTGFGGWYHTLQRESDIDASPIDTNFGLYVISERALTGNINAFVQLGFADAEKNYVSYYLGFGATKTGIFTSNDNLGMAIATALPSDNLPSTVADDHAETAIEIAYGVDINENFNIQPDIQYIINPGFSTDVDNALVFTLRLNALISF